MLDNLSIRTKNFLLIGLTVFICIFMILISLNLLQSTLKNERRVLIQDMTNMAHMIIKRKYDFFKQGRMGEEKAKKEAISALKSMKYSQDGYFFILHDDVMKMNPADPEKEGGSMINFTSPDGVQVFAEMIHLAKDNGSGYLSYQDNDPRTGIMANKIAYVQGFEKWGWLVGTGVYEHDMNTVLIGLVKKNSGLIVIAIVVFVLLTVLIYLINRSFLARVIHIKYHLEKFAQGDFTENIQPVGNDEFGQMLVSMGHVKTQMSETLQQLCQTAQNVQLGISKITDANVHLAQRTEKQASNLADSNSALSSISSSVRENSNNVQQASHFAREAQETVERGSDVVKEAVEAMEAITTSSAQVTDIVDVIDGIAFQTNLLALNAAVEAARAGEQGKGFAVVANEVRNLAQRCTTSAQDIKSLIEKSERNIVIGSELVSRSGRLLDEILHSSQKASSTLQDIAAATQQQAEYAENTSTTISALDEFVQHNAGMVEQVASSSTQLLSEADAMLEIVKFFSINAEFDLCPIGNAPIEPKSNHSPSITDLQFQRA